MTENSLSCCETMPNAEMSRETSVEAVLALRVPDVEVAVEIVSGKEHLRGILREAVQDLLTGEEGSPEELARLLDDDGYVHFLELLIDAVNSDVRLNPRQQKLLDNLIGPSGHHWGPSYGQPGGGRPDRADSWDEGAKFIPLINSFRG